MQSAFKVMDPLGVAAAARTELLRKANDPDSAVPRRQVAAHRSQQETLASEALTQLSDLAELAEQHVMDLEALGSLPEAARLGCTSLLRELQVEELLRTCLRFSKPISMME